MKVSDFQFPRHFLTHEAGLPESSVENMLNTQVEIVSAGDSDLIINRGNKLICHNPSSVTKFIFGLLYNLIEPCVQDPIHKDKLTLGLFQICKEHVYSDGVPIKSHNSPPLLVDLEKIHIPAVIIKELIEPVYGLVPDSKILFTHCNFTDSCRQVNNIKSICDLYQFKKTSLTSTDVPLVLSNFNIYNEASKLSHILINYLEIGLGVQKSSQIIKDILLDYESGMLDNVVLILRTLNGDPLFVSDFLCFLSSYCISTEESDIAVKNQKQAFMTDNYLASYVKTAGDSYTPHVSNQWTQWSMIMGLIEKQLAPMRGSMWPTSKALGPYENRLQKAIKEQAVNKKKPHLNFEEMLEESRKMYQHNAVEPGKLIETVMKDNRVWKG